MAERASPNWPARSPAHLRSFDSSGQPPNELAILQTPLTRPVGTLARVPMSDRIQQWSKDSRHLYTYRRGERPLKVWLYDIDTGQRRLWREFPVEAFRRGSGCE